MKSAQQCIRDAVTGGDTLTAIGARTGIDRTQLGRFMRARMSLGFDAWARLHAAFPGSVMEMTTAEFKAARVQASSGANDATPAPASDATEPVTVAGAADA